MTKLQSPVAQGTTWLGNRAIDTTDIELRYYGGWVYKYDNIDQPYDNGLDTFNNTITVNAVNDSLNNPDVDSLKTAYAERTFMQEVYANNIGMVYRAFIRWTYDPGTQANACRKGHAVVMRAIDHN